MILKITDLIFRKNKVLTKEQCNNFIKIFEKYSKLGHKEQSRKYAEVDKNEIELDNFTALDLNLNSNVPEIEKAVFEAWSFIGPQINNYIEYLKLNISPTINSLWINSTSNIRILKYSKGEFIKDHLDVNHKNRASCTINLNEEYTGGEFTFFSGKHIETFKTGDIMIFPAEPIWIHGTKPILSGTRYAINCFLHSNFN
jgi:hypothetical protein